MVNEYLGKDIKLQDNDIQFSKNQDFKIVDGVENLTQAIINRLSTIKGEYVLNDLYGSELNSDLGLPGNDFIISGLKGHIVEVLNQEPRISEFNIDGIIIEKGVAIINLTITSAITYTQFNMIYDYYLTGATQ